MFFLSPTPRRKNNFGRRLVTICRRRGAAGVWANFATMKVQNVWGQAVLGMDLFSISHKKAANLRHEAVDPQNVKKKPNPYLEFAKIFITFDTHLTLTTNS